MAAKKKAKKAARKKAPAKKTKAAAKKKAPAKKNKASAKKKKKTVKAAARPTKKKVPAKKKIPAKRKASAKKKAPAKKTVSKTAGKSTKNRQAGEGNYAASRAFLNDQAGFVERNRDMIPELGKKAEAALEGPEGDSLRDAEAAAAGRSRDTFGA